jgi:putative Ig domain-containing protein
MEIKICLTIEIPEGVDMSQVEVVVTGTIGSAPQPLTITPTTFTLNAESGVALPPTPIASVTGGVPPYTYSLDPAITTPGTVPNGLTLAEDNNGNISISGTPTDPSGTAVDFGVIATDSAGAVAGAQFKAITAKK